MPWRRTKSLTFRLTATLIVSLALLLSATAMVQIGLQQHYAETCATTNGLALSEVVYGALQSSMLSRNGHRQLQRSVEQLVRESPNVDVRIYNKSGLVAVASKRGLLGTTLQSASVGDNKKLCESCHPYPRPPAVLTAHKRVTAYDVGDKRYLAIIRPIPNTAGCAKDRCHEHPPRQKLLGLLHVTLALEPAERNRRDTAILMVVASIIAIVLVVFIVLVVVRREVKRPVEHLRQSVAALGAGDYSARYEHDTTEELDELGNAFNRMANELQRANIELLQWNQRLERRVDEKTAALQQAQEQIIQVERMASLGKLAAVVAHEINNPLASVVTYSKLLSKRFKRRPELLDAHQDAPEILDAISSEASRCGDIVTNLLLFARRTGSQQEPTNANDAIGKALFLLKHKMDLARVKAQLALDPQLPRILCDPGQLEQALLALLVNAVEAMPDGGTVAIGSMADGSNVEIEIADSGTGMSDDVCAHIFEPFFTTKGDDQGKGLGLGLSVVYGIVQRNNGTIAVESRLGVGTTFRLRFTIVEQGE